MTGRDWIVCSVAMAAVAATGCKRTKSRTDGDAATDRTGDGASLTTEAEVRTAYEKTTRDALPEDACIERPEAFESLVLVGLFAHDRGCRLEGMFIGGGWSHGADPRRALAAHGWTTADAAHREAMAREWIEQVVGAFGSDVQTKTSPAFELPDTPAFVAPQVETRRSQVIFDAWVSPPAGMLPEAKYRHVRYSFDADGNVEPTALETFTVPLDRLR